jgi:N-acetylmuramic acid 6-phosphate etherase
MKSLNGSVSSNGTTDGSYHRLEAGLNGPFSSVWIAAAGMDRAGLKERVTAALTRRLNLNQPVNMRVTNDVDLLAATMMRHPEVSSSIVVISGTGSIAIRYSRDSNEVVPSRSARSGGWGHLLGDEGAGYAIGRQAICQVLSSIEEMKLSRRTSTLSRMEQEIVSFFNSSSRLKEDDASELDLLNKILMATDEQSAKSRIASVTHIVLSAVASGDGQARNIVSRQVLHLIDTTLGRLLDPRSHRYVVPSQCGLILSGSVMLHDAYQTIFQHGLAERGIQFAYTEAVPDAALVGIEYLLSSTELETAQVNRVS